MNPQVVLNSSVLFDAATEPTHHILSGSFRALSLFLLAFTPRTRSLSLLQRVDAYGPHQYLTLNPQRDRAYATSWALPPELSSWAIRRPAEGNEGWAVEFVNSAPITATSSYITLPPPYTHLYSAGGPTGEVHSVAEATGGFGRKLHQVLFVPEDELEAADKTRVALRYGSHAVEFSSRGQAFIPVLGTNAINMYSVDHTTGQLSLLSENKSVRPHDGPRHVVIHPNGQVLYAITEHTNFIDVYTISSTTLTHVQSQTLLPPSTPDSEASEEGDTSQFRGDTLRLAPSTSSHPAPRRLFATTRGAKTHTRGWLCALDLDPKTGLLASALAARDGAAAQGDEYAISRWRTPTSGGKANAIELIPRPRGDREGDTDEGVYIVLTDDDERSSAGVRVLEWTPAEGFGIVAEWPTAEEGPGAMGGGSHAVWLD